MQIEAFGKTDVGSKRDHNEDYLLTEPDFGIYIVCDGMGGHAAGEVASEMAATTARDYLMNHRSVIDGYDGSPESDQRIVRIVREAIETASSTVYEHATHTDGRAGMGCTFTMLLVVGDKAVMGHVGDSRLYLRRNGRVDQLSEDHSYVNEMLRRGMITPEAAKDSPYGNVITRAIGIQSTVQVDTLVIDLLPGDTFLICSDGLSGYTEDNEELERLLNDENIEGLPDKLIGIANERGGKDNITALVLHVMDDGASPRSTEVNLRLDTLRYVSLFRHLTMKELVQVLNAFRTVSYDDGEVVVQEGETSDGIFIILEGQLVVEKEGAQVATLQAGTHFGEMALLNQRPRSATVRTQGPARLLIMTREAFSDCVKRDPTMGVKFLWTFAQVLSLRLDEANELAARDGTIETEAPPLR